MRMNLAHFGRKTPYGTLNYSNLFPTHNSNHSHTHTTVTTWNPWTKIESPQLASLALGANKHDFCCGHTDWCICPTITLSRRLSQHSTILYFFVSEIYEIYDQYQNSNMNNKDYLVGLLTMTVLLGQCPSLGAPACLPKLAFIWELLRKPQTHQTQTHQNSTKFTGDVGTISILRLDKQSYLPLRLKCCQRCYF